MKKNLSILATVAMFAGISSNAAAAELLDIRTTATGSSVSTEISADIPMVYTYHKIPGQPRVVVDIADADPEKIEPLIIVSKGVISSISSDIVQKAGKTASRIIFNLISESDVSVAATADRKALTVTFSAASKAGPPPPEADTKLLSETDKPSERLVPTEISAEDPLKIAETPPLQAIETPVVPNRSPADPTAPAIPASLTGKHEPTKSAASCTPILFINKITAGYDYIDIQTNGVVGAYKVIKLTHPARIAVDIATAKSMLTTKSLLINKHGIKRVRIGTHPGYTRIVLDASKTEFPKHNITKHGDGLRINFN